MWSLLVFLISAIAIIGFLVVTYTGLKDIESTNGQVGVLITIIVVAVLLSLAFI